MYNSLGVRFADFISFFLNIPWKTNNLVSPETKFFHFHRIFKTGDGEDLLLGDKQIIVSGTYELNVASCFITACEFPCLNNPSCVKILQIWQKLFLRTSQLDFHFKTFYFFIIKLFNESDQD